MDADEDWLNATKPAAKDSPTLRQSTLSQVFMNMPSKPQPEKTETDDIQKAIELSLKDVSHNQGRKSSETSDVKIIEKENLSPFKRPLTPRKCKNNTLRQNGLKVKRRNKRSPSIDCDPDETVAPGSLNTGPTEASQGQVSFLPPLNGSVDPGVQLSLLCDDSQSLKSDDLPDIDVNPAGDSSHIGNLTDFRIEDLRKSTNPLTSTCIDVDDPQGGGEEESQSIPCSMKFGGGRKRYIRIPENFSEEPGNNFQNIEEDDFIPDHEDSFDREIVDSFTFNRVPSKEQPNFAHVDVVRKQDERRKLPAHKCDECREYYEGLGLSEEEIQKRMQTCSRHRAKHAAPGTPEHFWDIGMEDTLECEERGYVQTKDPDKEKPRFRRKRQLNKMF
ncbi:DNA endonuclease RBBP8-like [Saccostrea cucullata]|uniref:DNA endonuclease RBBP8-like n=1 Tax=Saccostrea cuccullata TaxID=36930 RepID=UPI002ED07522